jgi:hypothetical protein
LHSLALGAVPGARKRKCRRKKTLLAMTDSGLLARVTSA